MYDNHSDDGSQKLAEELGFEVRTFGYTNRLDDQDYLNVKNHCWKEERENGQRADYVIVADADEFVKLPAYTLTAAAPVVAGYNMISEKLPVEDIFEINTGAYSESYSKQAIFNPREIEEINFVHGCHRNHMFPPRDHSPGQGCHLFHFRQIGGLIRMLDRHAKYRPRMSKFNVKNKMGFHYGDPSWNELRIKEFNEEKRMEWEQLTSEAKQLW